MKVATGRRYCTTRGEGGRVVGRVTHPSCQPGAELNSGHQLRMMAPAAGRPGGATGGESNLPGGLGGWGRGAWKEEEERRDRVAQPVMKPYDRPWAGGAPPPRTQRCAPGSWSNAPPAPTSRPWSRAPATGKVGKVVHPAPDRASVEKLLNNILSFSTRVVDKPWQWTAILADSSKIRET